MRTIDVSKYKYCSKDEDCLSTRYDASTLSNNTLVIDDYWIRITDQQKTTIVNRLRHCGVLNSNEGWDEYHTIVIRLFYYPNRELVREIIQERKRIGPSAHQIGAHIRCGGYLADVNENVAMVTAEILSSIPQKMIELYNHHQGGNETYFYLSTDSSFAAAYIVESMKPVTVVSTNLYCRGHSTIGLTSNSTLLRALMELHLVSQSNSLLLTSSSTFSRIIRWMSNASRVMVIHAPYTNTNASWGNVRSKFQESRKLL